MVQTDLAALQWIAWAGMLADFSISEGSFAVGAEKTFRKENQCSLCDAIDSYEEASTSEAPQRRSPKPIERDVSWSFLMMNNPESVHTDRGNVSITKPSHFVIQEPVKNQFILSPKTPPPRTLV